jgi:DMSO/TMAO reductase YedYZ molybdopterin-dependent catalytic subunit
MACGSGLLIPGWARGAGGSRPAPPALEALPGKWPLIKKTYRPPNFETPLSYFNEPLTPNQAFYVRYHVVAIPQIDARGWKIRVAGASVRRPLELSLEALKREFEIAEMVAVNQCSGNRRGLFEPRVAGVQWGYGAMGNARWRGVRLCDVLRRAGLEKGAVEVVFDGADAPLLGQTPDFIKSLPLWKALDEHTLIAFEMNGEPLPHWNGAPARLVVPGWTATYWVKHLTSIQVIPKAWDGFWMRTAYRVPAAAIPVTRSFESQEAAGTTPVTEMVVNSLVTNLGERSESVFGAQIDVKGVAWDGGYGIAGVDVSADAGGSWRPAELGPDLGRYSWRQWSYRFTPGARGALTLLARSTNRKGDRQGFKLTANPAGYHHNLVQRIHIQVL